jgi:hypothetical protein
MKLSVVYQPSLPASASPYRVCDQEGREFHWANAFLDGQHLRQLSPRSLRIYAYDLLDFARWFEPRHKPFAEITESTLVDYVRSQLEQDPKPTPQTVNHRLGTVRCCYRFHTGQELPAGQVHFQRRYTLNDPRSAMAGLATPSPGASASNKSGESSCRFRPKRSLNSGKASAPSVISHWSG